jgi:hypothetical protein
MKQFSGLDQTMFSDLVQKVFDADFDENFPENGTFLKQKRRNREYYYYKAYETSGGDGPTKTKLKYVGPADEPEITRRVEAFQRSKTGYRVRREIAAKLRRAGLPSPPHFEGQVVAALAKAGIFRLRANLVGSVAYQTYSGVLGVRLPDELISTGDVDIAQFRGISILIDETMPDLENVLKKVDPTFEPSFSASEQKLFGGFKNAAGFKVEFLTPNRGNKKLSTQLSAMPSLGPSVGARVLRYLDFLIYEPIRSVVLHDAGVPVLVPAPERYAIHKLIVAIVRNESSQEKANKDINQSAALIRAFDTAKRGSDLGFAWMEAWERGSGWRRRLGVGALRLSDETFLLLSNSVAEAAKLDGKSAGEYGLDAGKEGLRTRIGFDKRSTKLVP